MKTIQHTLLVALLFMGFSTTAARAQQWTQAGLDIMNTNPGSVLVGEMPSESLVNYWNLSSAAATDHRYFMQPFELSETKTLDQLQVRVFSYGGETKAEDTSSKGFTGSATTSYTLELRQGQGCNGSVLYSTTGTFTGGNETLTVSLGGINAPAGRYTVRVSSGTAFRWVKTTQSSPLPSYYGNLSCGESKVNAALALTVTGRSLRPSLGKLNVIGSVYTRDGVMFADQSVLTSAPHAPLLPNGNHSYLPNGARLGIGVANPSNTLDVNGGIDLATEIRHNGDENTKIAFSGNDRISFVTNGSNRMYIHGSGRVGVGTTNPLHTLDVNGTLHSDQALIGADDLGSGDQVMKVAVPSTVSSTNHPALRIENQSGVKMMGLVVGDIGNSFSYGVKTQGDYAGIVALSGVTSGYSVPGGTGVFAKGSQYAMVADGDVQVHGAINADFINSDNLQVPSLRIKADDETDVDGWRIHADPNRLAFQRTGGNTGLPMATYMYLHKSGMVEIGVPQQPVRLVGSRIEYHVTQSVPDYVFAPDYDLMSIQELEAYVQEHSHLPNVPSEAEIQEAGYVNMETFNNALLEKVEELTLYTIQQAKQLEALQTQIDELKAQSGQ